MFTDARRYLASRNSFAIDCKRLTSHNAAVEEMPLPERGLFLSRLTGHLLVYREYLKVLRSTGLYGLTDNGGWTNGFLLTSKRFAFTIANSRMKFPHSEELLDNAHRASYGCLIFTKDCQRSPIVSIFASGKNLFFGVREFDTALSRLAKLDTRNIELFVDKRHTGLVFSLYGVPSIYLSKLQLPSFFEPLVAAQSEKFYAYCGN